MHLEWTHNHTSRSLNSTQTINWTFLHVRWLIASTKPLSYITSPIHQSTLSFLLRSHVHSRCSLIRVSLVVNHFSCWWLSLYPRRTEPTTKPYHATWIISSATRCNYSVSGIAHHHPLNSKMMVRYSFLLVSRGSTLVKK